MSDLEPTKQTNTPEAPESAGKTSPQQAVVKFAKQQPPDGLMLTLFGAGYGTYQARPENFVLSFVTHAAALGLMLFFLHLTIPTKIIPPTTMNAVDLAPYVIPLKVGKNGPSGGSGGDASKLKASAGVLPKTAKDQFVPPTVLQPQTSKLMIQPTVVADLRIPQTGQIGDPLSKLMTASNGTGVGGGIGTGEGGGVGSGRGPGVGPGIFHVGDGVSAPKAIYTPEPEFSEEARKSKYQGVVVLDIVVGIDGRVHSPRVVRSLGMGLDEKAIEKVNVWKFDPAKKDGRPVAVEMNIEVAFNLY